MHTVLGILLLVTLAASTLDQFDTCDGAYTRLMDLDSVKCPPSLMKTVFTACGNLNTTKSRTNWVYSMNYQTMLTFASICGHNVSILKAALPALNTFDGASARFHALMIQCPGQYSPDTCVNDVYEVVIISIDDNTLSLMKTGFTAWPVHRGGTHMQTWQLTSTVSISTRSPLSVVTPRVP
jgi:hypothetical protein